MNIVIVQGEELIKEYEQSNDKIQFILKRRDLTEVGKILVKEFETEEEKQAYLQGFEDSEGWNKSHFIENERANEIAELINTSKIYIVKDNFYQEDMPPSCELKIFAGEKAYERAISFLMESANAQNTFIDFLKTENDFRTKNLYWEIEEQTLEMWSAESIDVLENIRELGRYADKYTELNYKEREIDYGVIAYSFEKSSV